MSGAAPKSDPKGPTLHAEPSPAIVPRLDDIAAAWQIFRLGRSP
jgi:hypothetical protein